MDQRGRYERLVEYVKDIEVRRLPELRESLALWNREGETLLSKVGDAEWVDLTQSMKANDERVIALYEEILLRTKEKLAAFERGEFE